MMKSLIQATVVAAVFVAPVAFAQQSNAPLTRAQVRAELVQLEKAGYRPGDGDHTTYPAEIQAAEARVAAQNGEAQAGTRGVGGVANGSSESGAPAAVTGAKSIYFGH